MVPRAAAAALIAVWATSSSAAEQDSPLVAACKQAAAHYYMSKQHEMDPIQDFSNLNPPRVRMKLKNDMMGGSVSCTFKARTVPFGLTEFCASISCFKRGDPRFDEIAELLRRDGL